MNNRQFKAMQPNESLEIISNAIQTGKLTRERDIALAIAQKALDKQIPKEPIKDNDQYESCVLIIGARRCDR